MGIRVTKARFAQMVQDVLSRLPQPFAGYVEEVPVEVRDWPAPRQLQDLGMEPDELLMGLYVGHPRTDRSVNDSGSLPDMILIFQEPIQQVCDTEQQLRDEIRLTVLHEIGHHFGLDEQDLDELGYG